MNLEVHHLPVVSSTTHPPIPTSRFTEPDIDTFCVTHIGSCSPSTVNRGESWFGTFISPPDIGKNLQ